jgi:hypothetical protein
MLSEVQNPDTEILELINEARLVLGMPALNKLPKGVPETSQKCVLGRSLGAEILLDDQDRAYVLLLHYRAASRLARAWGVAQPNGMWNGWGVLLPEPLDRFVHEFDALCYPQLTYGYGVADDGVRSELRHLRFDWVDEGKKVSDLIERAQDACAQAQALQKRLSSTIHNR